MPLLVSVIFVGSFILSSSVKAYCDSGQWSCDADLCLDGTKVCDGEFDCIDLSDEDLDSCRETKPLLALLLYCSHSWTREHEAVCPEACKLWPQYCYYALFAEHRTPGTCALPPVPRVGSYTIDNIVHHPSDGPADFTLVYTCPSGLSLEGNNPRCVGGNWTSDFPRCETVPECGTLTENREALVMNGVNHKRVELPWHAGVYDKKFSPYMQICGGTLVSTTVVISAAHCFWKDVEHLRPAREFAVVVGKYYRPFNEDDGGQKTDVRTIKIPARFIGAATNFQDDIALVFLGTAVVPTDYVRPVCLDFSMRLDQRQLRPGKMGKVAGWGLTAQDGKPSPILKVTELAYVDVGRCIAKAPVTFYDFITGDKICAGAKNGTAVCQGDSGGGLVFPSWDRGVQRWYLRGVSSIAPGNEHLCNFYSYSYFTHVIKHERFITKHLNKWNRCLLPAFPEHGSYTMEGRPSARPGQVFDSVTLSVTCEPPYRPEVATQAHCSNGEWYAKVPECKRFCKLNKHPSVTYLCKPTDPTILSGNRICNEYEPSGTEVMPKCNVNYHSGALAYMNCIDGSWDYTATCEPECGTLTPKGEALVINGVSAKRGELPWHVGIYDRRYTPYMQICGGSLASTTIVISAAHCFWNDVEGLLPAKYYAVGVGKIYRPWNFEEGGQKSDVSDIKIPPHFSGAVSNFQDDIAIIILVTPVVLTNYVRPVCIDLSVRFDESQLQPGNKGKVAGWGLTAEDGDAPQVLKVMELPYVAVEQCIADLPFDFRSYITSDKICAGSTSGTALCKGDSGGGLVFPVVERVVQRWYLRGVVSTAPSNGHKCNANSYTSFTQLLKHDNFVRKHLNKRL